MSGHRVLHIRTTVLVPDGRSRTGDWVICPELPAVFGDDRVSCGVLGPLVASQAGIVSRLLPHHAGFRLLARDGRTRLRAFVEWARDPDTGLWEPVSEPCTRCAHGPVDRDQAPLRAHYRIAA